ncbi:transglutaminase-like domain-containing protein [Paenibacillus campi]|uniref:transglutaminase-like domain-containing protein n=1 Tax=Paenibacillus campi TaxID=3106031 RepID=UPI002AFF48C0|nr:transglutaminase-like domain-containing protein [Paenibacillus sp. SGZ-1009]
MKKLVLACSLAVSFLFGATTSVFAAETNSSSEWLDTSNMTSGYIAVKYTPASSARTKVMIAKSGTTYTYDLNAVSAASTFPLQLGNGTYEVTLLENTSGNSYRKVSSDSLNVTLSNPNSVYLASTQNINWENSSAVIAKARELTANATTDTEKAQAIYDYITSKVKYDYNLAAALPAVYVPNPAQTLTSNKGICYDYSSLNAAMLRSVGIPTKLDMGTSTKVKEYHAWNEVLLNGKWVVVDTTVDATVKQSGKKTTLAANASDYKAVKVY